MSVTPNLSMQQSLSLLKTLGITVQNLWGKSNRFGPHTALGQQADAELVEALEMMQELVSVLLAAMSPPPSVS